MKRSMRRFGKLALAAALVAVVATTSGCFRRVRIQDPSKTQTVSRRIEAGDATSVAARISFGAGELELSGSDIASDAVLGEFTFSPSTLAPELVSNIDAEGVLHATVTQPDVLKTPITLDGPVDLVQRWDIKLSDALPTELILNMGAGDADLDFSSVDLTDLWVNLGAGSTSIDLTGSRTRQLRATVAAGAGEIVVRLPKDLPVSVTGASEGIGQLKYDDGFTKSGDRLTNDAWAESSADDTATPRVELNIKRGVGDVKLELAD